MNNPFRRKPMRQPAHIRHALSLATIDRRILFVHGHKVMLDSDLAELYGVQTKALLQAVRRNPERFPPDFAFPLKPEELANLRSQFVTSSWGGRRHTTVVFTEQGVAMLSSVLRSTRGIRMNVAIMRAFVRLRGILAEHRKLTHRLEEWEKRYDSQFRVVFDAIRRPSRRFSLERNRLSY
jgi:hypothetical protein